MKSIFTIFAIVIVLLIAHSSLAFGAVCRFQPNDTSNESEIIGKGKNINEARSKASEQCFERRMALLDQRGRGADEEQGLMIIDSCVNINCK